MKKNSLVGFLLAMLAVAVVASSAIYGFVALPYQQAYQDEAAKAADLGIKVASLELSIDELSESLIHKSEELILIESELATKMAENGQASRRIIELEQALGNSETNLDSVSAKLAELQAKHNARPEGENGDDWAHLQIALGMYNVMLIRDMAHQTAFTLVTQPELATDEALISSMGYVVAWAHKAEYCFGQVPEDMLTEDIINLWAMTKAIADGFDLLLKSENPADIDAIFQAYVIYAQFSYEYEKSIISWMDDWGDYPNPLDIQILDLPGGGKS